jgi:hypothetical protein
MFIQTTIDLSYSMEELYQMERSDLFCGAQESVHY